MKKLWIGILINIQFFTAIPIRSSLPMEKAFITSSVRTFPILGIIQGLIYSSFVYILLNFSPFSLLAVSFLLWLGMICLTGGLHLDGWMDASDAFFSYQDQEKRLEIMKDPRIGAFGVLSVLLLLSAKFLFIYEILQNWQTKDYILLLILPFFSKMVMGLLLIYVPEAKDSGLGSFFKRAAHPHITVIYLGYISFCFVGLFFLYKDILPIVFLLFTASLLSYLFLSKKIVSWFGGLTGDLLGASVEGVELILWASLWLLHYFVMA
ncbi:adenosylcobinamide-GDP ribazoletransferase [Niallia sp. NCCP-28]|uniref:adenosylcobinamide-GDP ribazoletransferase n=1 Tax=Niallia sp. NCCP-28 TaxID=2934712 RepID=UPI002088CEBB|nr:adenosylcobinamide-GDP ribazoletransferase [Niallia sp. NCCP-28]GKU84659.1 adenosylcobinamide-GDP ribazoletransferase [Niallia sp. NCCP-28]